MAYTYRVIQGESYNFPPPPPGVFNPLMIPTLNPILLYFQPHYAHIICQALLYHYQLHHYPYSDFQIYEIGAGNGSLMIDMLTYLRRYHPHIFERTKYTIIEISEALATRQRERVKAMEEQDPAWKGKVTVDNVDWFEWEGSSKESCYFVALEVFVSTRFDLLECTVFR